MKTCTKIAFLLLLLTLVLAPALSMIISLKEAGINEEQLIVLISMILAFLAAQWMCKGLREAILEYWQNIGRFQRCQVVKRGRNRIDKRRLYKIFATLTLAALLLILAAPVVYIIIMDALIGLKAFGLGGEQAVDFASIVAMLSIAHWMSADVALAHKPSQRKRRVDSQDG